MFIRAIAAAAAIALSASPLYAGQSGADRRQNLQSAGTPTPQSPPQEVVILDEPEVCDPYIFDYAANYSASWAIQGIVYDWFFLTEPNIPAFITLWNNTHPDNKVPEGKAFNQVVVFKIPEGSQVGPAGEYVFLYLDGCYVDVIQAPLPPDNESPPEAVKVHWGSLKQWEMMGQVGLR